MTIDEHQTKCITTKIIKGNPAAINSLRLIRIKEAIQWDKGSPDNPIKHVVDTLENNIPVYFAKPGKEAIVENSTNPNDMYPNVGSSEQRMTFQDIWGVLARLSVFNFEIFKIVMVLIYRNCWLIDHKIIGTTKVRYKPKNDVLQLIKQIDTRIEGLLPFQGLLGFLSFLDILGWNEDVKYFTKKQLDFNNSQKSRIGRINNFLSTITVPFLLHSFLLDVSNNTLNPEKINHEIITDVLQRLVKSRGICPVKQKELQEWLSPYIYK
ncbi:hypothetical protein ACFL5P_00475 [candidate division KSB1 bacterium]